MASNRGPVAVVVEEEEEVVTDTGSQSRKRGGTSPAPPNGLPTSYTECATSLLLQPQPS